MVLCQVHGDGDEGDNDRCGDEDDAVDGDGAVVVGGDDAVDQTCHLQAPAVRQPIKV